MHFNQKVVFFHFKAFEDSVNLVIPMGFLELLKVVSCYWMHDLVGPVSIEVKFQLTCAVLNKNFEVKHIRACISGFIAACAKVFGWGELSLCYFFVAHFIRAGLVPAAVVVYKASYKTLNIGKFKVVMQVFILQSIFFKLCNTKSILTYLFIAPFFCVNSSRQTFKIQMCPRLN